MSQIVGPDRAYSGTQPRRQIDNSQLYENIGNIVIERAHAGDRECENINARAWLKTKASIS